jgi:hypothetical protein
VEILLPFIDPTAYKAIEPQSRKSQDQEKGNSSTMENSK